MRAELPWRVLLVIATSIAIIAIGGCAARPGMDGGIVGTGNQTDCASQQESRNCEPRAR